MLSNCTKNLLNLKDLIVKRVKNFENSVEIYAELPFSDFLCEYFKIFPKEQIDNVKYLVTDLWKSYKDIDITYFRKENILKMLDIYCFLESVKLNKSVMMN